jgi:hypothetical protein
MKKIVSFVLSLAFAGSTFAQMSGYSSSSYSEGTALGSNETLTADGIALGNAVKLRGYIDTRLSHVDTDGNASNPTDTSVSADMDFLIDLSPVTAEVHLNVADSNGSLLEQAFGRYSFNEDFHLTFGRQETVLGYEGDEATDLLAVTKAFSKGAFSHPGRSYVDGIRLNYNNGLFGLVFGVHDHYGINGGADDNLDDGMAIDLAASVMFFPGLEAQLGFVNENGAGDDDSQVVNAWIEWNPGDLTLAAEFDSISHHSGADLFDLMLLANYRFSDFFSATIRYAFMDDDSDESNRITLAALLTITDNFGVNFEYSHKAEDNDDENEFYVQGLITY